MADAVGIGFIKLEREREDGDKWKERERGGERQGGMLSRVVVTEWRRKQNEDGDGWLG